MSENNPNPQVNKSIQDLESIHDYIFCSKCGQKNSVTSKFCIHCGNSLKGIEDNIKDITKNIKESINNNETYKNLTNTSYSQSSKANWENQDMINLIQKNTEYYIPKFKQMQDAQKTISWNWASFFFNSLWFLYRKMYIWGFGIIGVSFILNFIPILGPVASLALSILSGLYGNILYLNYTQKQLNEFDNLNDDVKLRVLLSKGGVNIVIPIVVFIIFSIILLILGFFSALLLLEYPYYY